MHITDTRNPQVHFRGFSFYVHKKLWKLWRWLQNWLGNFQCLLYARHVNVFRSIFGFSLQKQDEIYDSIFVRPHCQLTKGCLNWGIMCIDGNWKSIEIQLPDITHQFASACIHTTFCIFIIAVIFIINDGRI